MTDDGRLSDSESIHSVLPEPATREQRMVEMRLGGATLGAIGAEFGLSRERVRQIIQAVGGPSPAEVRARALARSLAREAEARSETEAALRELLATRGAQSVQEAVEALGLGEAMVVRFWPEDLGHLLIRPAGYANQTWTDGQILDVIRSAAIYEFPLTANAYSELVRVGEVKGPSLPRVTQRFGGWIAACELAGVEPGQTLRSAYESRWTDAELLSFVREYLVDSSWPNSAHRFDEWRRQVAPDAPSFQTIRNRLGTWSNAKRLALRPGEGDP
jgi:hypothetical protein